CRAALHAGSLGQALERLCEFYCLFDAGPQMRLAIDGSRATLSAWPSRAAPHQELFIYELALSTFHRFAGWAIRQQLPLRSVSFIHSRPAYADNYGWLFPDCPTVFDGACA